MSFKIGHNLSKAVTPFARPQSTPKTLQITKLGSQKIDFSFKGLFPPANFYRDPRTKAAREDIKNWNRLVEEARKWLKKP